MDTRKQHTLLRQIMWDYNIPPEELFEVLHGKREYAGHYNREKLLVKLLESYPWFTILKILPADELKEILTDDVIYKIRSRSLRIKYEYAKKRLQELVPDTK